MYLQKNGRCFDVQMSGKGVWLLTKVNDNDDDAKW